ncbi:NAD-dependent epimerase/dehydratase family protein [Mucilaginibacter sp. P25]|jgi:nucleoside-diphosphate-sugar epimerase|uniref:Nucleoside-diphosphate-sugar epimerase n=1 Tax=Mucilaginibacter gossypii TaxID=551996 RepID=A0A1G8FYS2_9SPHI|nr:MULTISPECIES: NAD-dependent epimerase/dehydratase family protein [Mucilaginibacter]NVM61826.1 nucleoside-diphosphate-sugar epimerase [Mucilaginibacter sp. SG538B]SCW85258.1 Nucleoside-diphosphate-sugar epimerase [Mucilaginibacter sp. NFR10]SDH87245.1 Nucleoside-diphosphate-sugar epimerase [Mucilaginibacter gossypii]
MSEKILVIGANGQIGTELVMALRNIHGAETVIASDINSPTYAMRGSSGPFELINVLDKDNLHHIFDKHRPTQVYLLAAILSAVGEQKPKMAWDLNMTGLLHVLDFAVEFKVSKVFWPSSIAVFGPHSPQHNTPQYCVMDPNTVYGFSKLAGERWCEYYFNKYGLDVRSIRYPGLIGWKANPGGGTTDYAVHIFHQALKTGSYESFLAEGTALPMMYMDDAIRATISLMDAPAEQISIRSSYNLAGISFTPEQLAAEIKKLIPKFEISYSNNDPRQAIADSWPKSIDDSYAQNDWGWKLEYDLPKMVADMLTNLKTII